MTVTQPVEHPLAIFGELARTRCEHIMLAAAFCDNDQIAQMIDKFPFTAIEKGTRRFLFRAARNSRRIYCRVDRDTIFRLAVEEYCAGTVGFYSDALPKWKYAVLAKPELIEQALKWLVENASK